MIRSISFLDLGNCHELPDLPTWICSLLFVFATLASPFHIFCSLCSFYLLWPHLPLSLLCYSLLLMNFVLWSFFVFNMEVSFPWGGYLCSLLFILSLYLNISSMRWKFWVRYIFFNFINTYFPSRFKQFIHCDILKTFLCKILRSALMGYVCTAMKLDSEIHVLGTVRWFKD